MDGLALTSLGLGLLSGSALLIGAGLGLVRDWPERLVAGVMAFGSGALIAALASLVEEGHARAGFGAVVSGFLLGALLFVVANHLVNARGGFLRKPATLYRFLRERRRQRALQLLERLSQVELFRALPPEEVQALVPFAEERHYRAGQTIFRQGDPGDALYLIESGGVEIHQHGTAERAEAVLELGEGEAFGELALLAGHPHHSTALARADVHLWRIRKDRLELLEEHSPRLRAALEALRTRHLEGRSSSAAHPTPRRWHQEAVRHLEQARTLAAPLTDAEHHAQVEAHADSSTAILMGALLDGIPESAVIGASLLGASPDYVFVIAVFLSNLPEALASAAGMRHHGYSPGRVLGLWGSLVLCSGLAALLGNAGLANAPVWLLAGAQALAAGSILAMLADTMMPEAFEKGGPLVALWTSLGFLTALFVESLGH